MEMCHFSTWKFQAGSFIQTVGSALLLTLALLWGSAERQRQKKTTLQSKIIPNSLPPFHLPNCLINSGKRVWAFGLPRVHLQQLWGRQKALSVLPMTSPGDMCKLIKAQTAQRHWAEFQRADPRRMRFISRAQWICFCTEGAVYRKWD